MEHLGIGFQLMVVGMTTVFLILYIVIYGGRLLITAVNRFAPAEESKAKKSTANTSQAPIDATTMQVLDEVVKQITNNTGHIADVRKL